MNMVNRCCHNCGAEATESQGFCSSCGADLRMDMITRYCHNCGTAGAKSQSFCGSCGADWRQSDLGTPTRWPAANRARLLDYRIPLGRVLSMTALSGGLYLPYWLYITWKQFRDHTSDPQAYPVWHAFTLLIPLYWLFRFHYHVSAYGHLIAGLGRRPTITAGAAVLLLMLSNGAMGVHIYYYEIRGVDAISQTDAMVSAAFLIASTALVTWVLYSVQVDLNRYWEAFAARGPGVLVTDAKLGFVAIALVIVGVLFWIIVIGEVASESFRTETI